MIEFSNINLLMAIIELNSLVNVNNFNEIRSSKMVTSNGFIFEFFDNNRNAV